MFIMEYLHLKLYIYCLFDLFSIRLTLFLYALNKLNQKMTMILRCSLYAFTP